MKSVLVIDFNKDNLSLTQNILNKKYEVFIADSVNAAKKIIKNSSPDILLINYVVPGSSGIDILKALAKACEYTLAMMMTNLKDMEIVTDAILHGFDGFVKIPVEMSKFEEQLKKAQNIHNMRNDASDFLKVKATKAMSVTFAHYTRNLLTPLMGYLSSLKGVMPENTYKVFDTNLHKIDKLTHKLDKLLENGKLKEFSYTDETEFYDIELDDD